ncbi:MAG: hypothetical protein GF401_17265 [Chitinivibrionales bacterium]|nr:hypothetical protein [Chitinivibrionales bacterium]
MASSQENHTLYVSPTGNDGWSGKIAEPAANRKDGPLRSIGGALDTARKISRTKDSPLNISLQGGRYSITSPIVLKPQDSHLHFEAYKKEKPVIDAGIPITDWNEETLNGTTVWTADVSLLLESIGYFKQLFVNSRRAPRPRLPKKDYFWIDNAPETDPAEGHNRAPFQKNRFHPKKGDFKNFRNITDSDVIVMHWWTEERRPVASYDEKQNLVTLAKDTLFILVDDCDTKFAKYYIDNVFEAMTEPGEWYLDRTEKKVYYLPREGETIDNCEIIAAGPSQLICIDGDPGDEKYVENVTFYNIGFENTDWREHNWSSQSAAYMPAAITLHGAKRCAIEDCAIRNIGIFAIDLQHGCKECRIVGNTIEEMGAGGIKINGSRHTLSKRTKDNTITDNHIHALGRIHHGAAAIIIRHSSGNLIAHNHIHDLYYTAITCGWVWGYWESVTRDNRIEKNHIHHVGQQYLNDMGAIYMLGVQPGTLLRGNIIHDIQSIKYGGWAIYLDEGSSDITIENNICFDSTSQLFHIHFGRENQIRNNIWAFGGEGIVGVTRGKNADLARKKCIPDGRVSSCFTFERNIVITDGTPVFLGGMADESGELQTKSFISDLNLYYDIKGRELRIGNGGHIRRREGTEEFFDWKTWQSWRNDRHSVIADPKCNNIDSRDFTMAPDSPAQEIDFVPIDISDVGPRQKEKRSYFNLDVKEDPEKRD